MPRTKNLLYDLPLEEKEYSDMKSHSLTHSQDTQSNELNVVNAVRHPCYVTIMEEILLCVEFHLNHVIQRDFKIE